MMNPPDPTDLTFDALLDDAEDPPPATAVPTTPVQADGIEDDRRADDAERNLTHALAALRRKGRRAIDRIENVLEPRHIAIGVGVVAGLAVLYMLTRQRRPRLRRAPSIGGTIARSLVREALGRMVLGAAATAGARLAEAAVPMLVASLSAREVRAPATRRRPPRRRTASAPPGDIDEIE